MSASIELVLLKCVRCTAPLPAEEDEVAWVCAQCGQGQQLTSDGLAPLAVHWAAARAGLKPAWRPFWVFTGTAAFARRETFGRGRGPDKLWAAPRRFYVPAFPIALEKLEVLGAGLTLHQVPLNAGPAIGDIGRCTLFPEDARQAAEFIVLTIEADLKDKLKTIDFSLDLGEPELWVLPFEGEPETGQLALAK